MNKLTTEELLKQLESMKDQKDDSQEVIFPTRQFTRKSKHHNQIIRFIKEKNIASGTIRVPIYRLVHEYHKWAEKHPTRPTPYELSKVFRTMFEFKRSGANRAFMLNDFCDMSIKARKSSKLFYKKYILSKRDRKHEKKKDETCEFESKDESSI